MWIAIGAGIVLLIVLVAFITRKGTLYLPNPFGYVAISSGEPQPARQITRAQFRSLLPIMFEGKRIDFLQISYRQGEDEGVALSLDDGHVELWRNFHKSALAEDVLKFKQAMKEEGYEPREEPWNEGLRPESKSVRYVVPVDVSVAERLTYVALDAIEGHSDGDLFARAALIGDGPGNTIHFEPKRDLLEGLL